MLANDASLQLPPPAGEAPSQPGAGAPVFQATARQLGGLVVTLLGAGILASGLIINPWFARLVRGSRALDSQEVLGSYFLCSMVLGLVVIVLGRIVARRRIRHLDGFTLLVLLASAVVLADRLLLVRLGLPLWIPDPRLHYRNRPGAVRTLAEQGRPSALVRINRYGHHDSEFPLQKPAGELRGLVVGDSVVMGHGVTYEETMCKHLEDLLDARDAKARAHQVINAGVHGYSIFQEVEVLKESLVFDPDFIAVGFCMNDITEPFKVNRDFGGAGIDYHGVLQARSWVSGYLINETGFGRLLQSLRGKPVDLEAENRSVIYKVRNMVADPMGDERFQEGWRLALSGLEEMYALARERQKPIVLLVFPFLMQLLDESLWGPQIILREHAAAHGVDVIDFTGILRRLIFDDEELLAALRRRGYTEAEILKFYAWKAQEYLLDRLHLADKGHRVVAGELFRYLTAKGLVADKEEPPRAPERNDPPR